jgi:mRNA interferase MazF
MASSNRPVVARGEIWLISLDPAIGSEQAKTRPCIVVQRDAANRTGRTTIVVPLTDAAGHTESTIKPGFGAGIGGLKKRSLALCHQVRAVDRLRLRKKLGTLDGRSMEMIDSGLLAILDLPDV